MAGCTYNEELCLLPRKVAAARFIGDRPEDAPKVGMRGLMLESTVAETDRRDIRASLGGDEQAFARLVERYEAQVSAQMWRFTRDRRTLDELVQDVFVQAYLSLPKFRGNAPFLHWLRRIATFVGYQHWRHQYRDRRHAQLLAERPIAPRADSVPPPSEAAERVFSMLEHLAPKDRLVLTLHYLEDCSTQEIAERTGWNSTLVRVRMHRATKRLRNLLLEAGYGRTPHE